MIVRGLLEAKGPATAFNGSIGIADIATAQKRFGMTGRLTRIDLLVPDDRVIAGDRGVLPGNARLERPSRRNERVEKMLRAFRVNLFALAGVALLVGMFLVYNTVLISILRRRKDVGVLKTLGVSPRQILTAFLLEGLIFGAIGSAAGIVFGNAAGVRDSENDQPDRQRALRRVTAGVDRTHAGDRRRRRGRRHAAVADLGDSTLDRSGQRAAESADSARVAAARQRTATPRIRDRSNRLFHGGGRSHRASAHQRNRCRRLRRRASGRDRLLASLADDPHVRGLGSGQAAARDLRNDRPARGGFASGIAAPNGCCDRGARARDRNDDRGRAHGRQFSRDRAHLGRSDRQLRSLAASRETPVECRCRRFSGFDRRGVETRSVHRRHRSRSRKGHGLSREHRRRRQRRFRCRGSPRHIADGHAALGSENRWSKRVRAAACSSRRASR